MSKRKYEDDSLVDENWKDKPLKPENAQHSLDSDEEGEVDEDKYDILEEDNIEGQEEGGVRREGDVQITPFNMTEEMEDGHFDTDGNFHWKKEKLVKDHWLDNIDWVKVQDDDKSAPVKESIADSDDSDVDEAPFDSVEAYKKILELMKPGETVAKTLRRLGGNKSVSASERWKKKKAGVKDDDNSDKEKVTLLTELANNLLTRTGNMDIYQENYEKISSFISSNEKKKKAVDIHSSDGLDMYADDFDTKEKEKMQASTSTSTSKESSSQQKEQISSYSNQANDEPELLWEYKEEKTSEEIKGPFTSAQMQQKVSKEETKNELWVRKVGSGGEFYTSKRIDFEIYM